MTTEKEPAAADRAWEAAKPRSAWRDKHGRAELLVHPFLVAGAAPPPRPVKRQPQG